MGKEALKEWISVGVVCLRVVLFCPLCFHLTFETGLLLVNLGFCKCHIYSSKVCQLSIL